MAMEEASSCTTMAFARILVLSCSCSATSDTTCRWPTAVAVSDVNTGQRRFLNQSFAASARRKVRGASDRCNMIQPLTRQLGPHQLSHCRRARRITDERHVSGHLQKRLLTRQCRRDYFRASCMHSVRKRTGINFCIPESSVMYSRGGGTPSVQVSTLQQMAASA